MIKKAQEVAKNPHLSSEQRISIREQRAELDIMHRERVAVRKEISNLRAEIVNVKKERDILLGTKTVRFQQVA
jgi:hypothetical protein